MGLRENLRTEPLTALSLRKIVTVPPKLSVQEAVDLMRTEKVGSVVVVAESGLPLGLFTEKLLIRLYANQPDAVRDPVRQHMSQRIVCLLQTDPIAQLIDVMQEHKLRWICVVDDHGRPVAMAGLRAVIEYVVDTFPRIVKVQPMEPKLAMQNREGA